ncbi:hypothetical protein EPO14_01320 [Patescibacteria group bacterium]|nr:MAG: hypothetical protein EPO14_01320 [Patescibacteria group bacterium]
MNLKRILIFSAPALFLGVVVGYLCALWPLEIDTEVNILDLLDLLFTIGIALMIPVFVNRLLENRKVIKTILVDELKALLSTYQKIKNILRDTQFKGEITKLDKDHIQICLEEADLQIIAFEEQLTIAFPAKVLEIVKDLKLKSKIYYKFVTGGDLMSEHFLSVDSHFNFQHNVEYTKIDISLKTLIQKLYNF